MSRTPDSWQSDALTKMVTWGDNVLLCVSRQAGKTETVAVAAYLEACLGSFVLVISASDRQAMEFFQRMIEHHRRLNLVAERKEPTQHELRLRSGGRVVALPNNEKTLRGYASVDMLVIDEAARVPDALYGAVCPMLAVSGGRIALLSTPFGRRGFFFKEWKGEGADDWQRFTHPWTKCPRLTPEFIERERRKHGDAFVDQEFNCCFSSVDSSFFDVEAFEGLVDPELETITW